LAAEWTGIGSANSTPFIVVHDVPVLGAEEREELATGFAEVSEFWNDTFDSHAL
jgi:hypothetical protein